MGRAGDASPPDGSGRAGLEPGLQLRLVQIAADEDGAAPLNEPEGIAIKAALQANDTITIVKKGLLDIGNVLTALAYGAPVYLSDTPGLLADSDPGEAIVIGEVWPSWGATTADKLLRVDL
jgi:hypothetical protein